MRGKWQLLLGVSVLGGMTALRDPKTFPPRDGGTEERAGTGVWILPELGGSCNLWRPQAKLWGKGRRLWCSAQTAPWSQEGFEGCGAMGGT